MKPVTDFTPSQAVDIVGELIAALAAFAAKVPANSPMAIPGGLRPTPEAIEAYEEIVFRFRERAGKSTFKILTPFFVDSLEAFEAGRVFDAVPPLQQAVEQLVELHEEDKVKFLKADQARIREFHRRLERLLPGATKPEVDLPPPTTY